LRAIESALRKGGRDFAALEENAMDSLKQRGWQPDYVAIRRQADLMLPSIDDRALVVLAAARLGTTRLIDNVEVSM